MILRGELPLFEQLVQEPAVGEAASEAEYGNAKEGLLGQLELDVGALSLSVNHDVFHGLSFPLWVGSL